jgi:hypothetical protein
MESIFINIFHCQYEHDLTRYALVWKSVLDFRPLALLWWKFSGCNVTGI